MKEWRDKEGGERDANADAARPGRSSLTETGAAGDPPSGAPAKNAGSLFGSTPPWSSDAGGGARGEGSSADNWQPQPRVFQMDAPAERETDITSKTQFEAPEATSGRRTVGIGEPVTLRSPTATSWTASAVGPKASAKGKGGAYRWVAPEAAGAVTITATAKDGSTQSVTFNVLEPQDIAFEKIREATPAEFFNHRVGGGMVTKVNLLPATVSWNGVSWQEEENEASNPAGFFLKNQPPKHVPTKVALPANALGDLAVYYNRAMPTGGGSFDWEIENTIQVRGGTSGTSLRSVQHVKLEESPREGFVTVSKRGANTPAAESSMRAPGGLPVKGAANGGGAKGCLGPANKVVLGDVIGKPGADTPVTAPNVDDDPKQVPPKFAALHADVIQLLVRSRPHLNVFTADPKLPFWKAIEAMSVADLHTLVQVQKGTMAAGLWSSIKALDSIYTYGTSWGIHFVGSPGAIVKNGDWGRDHPQFMVASQHPGGENFTWYRQNTGAGNPGLHLGVGNTGEHHDVHWDPTNPMESVGTGKMEWKINPFSPWPMPYVNPKGDAVYAIGETLAHMAEVGGVTGPSKNADTTKAYLDVYFLDESRKHATNYINMERDQGTKARTNNLGASETCVAQVQAQIDLINDITTQSRALAMQEDKTAKAEIDKLSMRVLPTRMGLINTLVKLFQHMKAEAPSVNANGYDTQAGWQKDTFSAYDTCAKLTSGRQKI